MLVISSHVQSLDLDIKASSFSWTPLTPPTSRTKQNIIFFEWHSISILLTVLAHHQTSWKIVTFAERNSSTTAAKRTLTKGVSIVIIEMWRKSWTIPSWNFHFFLVEAPLPSWMEKLVGICALCVNSYHDMRLSCMRLCSHVFTTNPPTSPNPYNPKSLGGTQIMQSLHNQIQFCCGLHVGLGRNRWSQDHFKR